MVVSPLEKHYTEHRGRLVKTYSFRLGSEQDAEDVVQEAYYRVLKYLNSFDGTSFDKWFSRIIKNCFLERKKELNGNFLEPLGDEEGEGEDGEEYSKHVMRNIYALIRSKNVVQKEVLWLHFNLQYTAKDISRVTDVSYANCHQIIGRFRREIKETLLE